MKKFLKRLFSSTNDLYDWHQNVESITKQQFIDYIDQCRMHIAAMELRSQTNKEIIETVRYILNKDENLRNLVLNELSK
jgi:hypothetical protein